MSQFECNIRNLVFLFDNSNFSCIKQQRIPYDALNDDYCDCIDATDEPGTSACQFSL
jgi:protein kinase C substrate 80K-H